MIYAALVSLVVVAIYLWQDGTVDCPDGLRYTSGRPQPHPFHRRWCGWPKRMLVGVSLASLVALGAMMGDWRRAALLITLPGAWLIATRPTTVDAPTMALAYGASMLFPAHPWLAVLMSCVGGFLHERTPVFAALYAWHPLLLVGLVCSGWWRTPAPPDADPRVGLGAIKALFAHRKDHDWLGIEQNLYAMRAVPLLAAAYGTSPAAWTSLAVTWASRLIGTDLARYALWAAPAMLRDMPDVPSWMVLAHVMTFRRMW